MSSNNSAPLSILLINHIWFAEELRSLGHRVLTAGWVHTGYDICFKQHESLETFLARLPSDFTLDRLVYYDDSCPPTILGLENLNVPSVFYSVDSHHHWAWHQHFAAVFSEVLVAQKDYLEKFAAVVGSDRVRWLPLWASANMEPEQIKSIDVCFRGNLDPTLHPKRAEFFGKLSSLVPIDCASGPFLDVYPKAKLVVNQAVGGDLNFRVFEAMGCGSMLLTPHINNGLCELFEPGEELVFYDADDIDGLAAQIRYYLLHEEERKRIAEAGHRKVKDRHTRAHRAQQLEAILFPLRTFSKDDKCIGAAGTYLHNFSSFLKYTTALGRVPSNVYSLAPFVENSLIHAISHRTEDATLETLLMQAITLLSKAELKDTLERICQHAYATSPESLFAAASYLWVLKRSGRVSEATEIASGFADEPLVFLSQVEVMMEQTTSQLWYQLSQDTPLRFEH